MAIKVNSHNLSKNKNIFSKLQHFTFSSLVSRVEDKAHLDVESQEIIYRLKENVAKLSDISGRMEFMMGELSVLIRKNS